MSAEKVRAFDAAEALVSYVGSLIRLYNRAVIPDADPGVLARRLDALAEDGSDERIAALVTDLRVAAGPAGIPFEQLQARLDALLPLVGELLVARPADLCLPGRVRHELNRLIGLRDYYTLAAKRAAAGEATPGTVQPLIMAPHGDPDGRHGTGGKVAERRTIWYHGERSYSLDGVSPVQVHRELDAVLRAFLGRTVALGTRDLQELVANPADVIRRLEKTFPGSVRRPAAKGHGYLICVRPAPKAN